MKNVIDVDRNASIIALPDTVTSLSDQLCFGMDNLIRFSISKGVKEIPRSCFCECHQLKKVGLPDGLEEIDSFAFESCYLLEDIIIPSSVISIGYRAFARCKNLRSIKIPQGVKYLPSGVFDGCECLESIELPEGLLSIGDNCFSGCRSLKEIVIPQSVEEIGTNPFKGCISLDSIDCQSPYYSFCEGLLYALDGKNKHMISYLAHTSEFQIPNNVLINADSFSGNEYIEKIFIPAGVKYIPSRAFYGCTSLKTIVFPEGIKEIDEEAFCYCESIATINLPNSVEVLGKGAFMFCKGLKKLTVPGSVKSIGYKAFGSCGISNLIIEEGVESIGVTAFGWNQNLRLVSLPNSITQIEENAFLNCPVLQEIIINPQCRSIASNAFQLCKNLRRIKIPANSFGFYSDLIPNYSHLLVEDSTIASEVKEPITVICPVKKRLTRFEDMFDRKSANRPNKYTIQRAIVPEGVEYLGPKLFKDCVSLEYVELPSTLKSIGNETFSGCISLCEIKVPASLRKIGKRAFNACKSLRKISIPEGIHSFPMYASPFDGCISLESISLPISLQILKSNIFTGCTSLKNLQSERFVLYRGAVYTSDMSVLVSYVSDEKNIHIPEGVKSIGVSAFSKSNIEVVTTPSSLVSIKKDAFGDCKSLSSVHLAPGLKRIESLAFDLCDNLSELYIPDGVTYIGEHAITIFGNTTIRLPRSLKIWKRSMHGGNLMTKYVVPNDMVEYYKKFIAQHIQQSGYIVEGAASPLQLEIFDTPPE